MHAEPIQSPMFYLPFMGILNFDKERPEKLGVVIGNKKIDIDITESRPLPSLNDLTPIIEYGGFTTFNVASKDGEMFRIGLKTENFAKISLLLMENIPCVRKNANVSFRELDSLGLTQEEYQIMLDYYNDRKNTFDILIKPTLIKRNDINRMPRSLAYVPNGYHKGIYALLKTHEKVEEVGLGSFNRVTLALPLNLNNPIRSNQLKVFRSAKKVTNRFEESETNKLLLNACDLYSVGVEFLYSGPMRSRTGSDEKPRELNGPKNHLIREENVNKVGYLSDYLEKGELFDLILKRPNFSFFEAIIFGLKYSHALAVLHDTYGIVHSDQKIENVFLTEDLDPRIGDFGFAVKKGKKQFPCGSATYLAPEILQAALSNTEYLTNTTSDVWGLGLILLSMFGIDTLKKWQDYFHQFKKEENNWKYVINNLKLIKKSIFEKKLLKTEPLIEVIDECLQKDPDDRASAIEVFNKMGVIYYALLAKDEKLFEEIFQCPIPIMFL